MQWYNQCDGMTNWCLQAPGAAVVASAAPLQARLDDQPDVRQLRHYFWTIFHFSQSHACCALERILPSAHALQMLIGACNRCCARYSRISLLFSFQGRPARVPAQQRPGQPQEALRAPGTATSLSFPAISYATTLP